MPAKEFHLQQGWNPLANNFKIKSGGKEVYQVKGDAMKWGKQSSFQTMDGTELASLKETTRSTLQPWAMFEWFKAGDADKRWASVKQEDWGSLDKKEISIDIPGENNYKITGDRLDWNFQIICEDGTKVGEISKKWGVRDNYGVRVEEGADEVDVLMCAILVDQIYHDGDE